MSDMTFEDFLDTSDEFVLITFIQDGHDPSYDELVDSGASANEKVSYLAYWDYGAENEHDDQLLSRDELEEEATLPRCDRYVEFADGNTYLLVEQVGAGAALYRAVPSR